MARLDDSASTRSDSASVALPPLVQIRRSNGREAHSSVDESKEERRRENDGWSFMSVLEWI